MATLKVRRIDFTTPNAGKQLQALRDQHHNQSNTVSPQSKKLTTAVFGSPLSPTQVVEKICQDVREKGLPSLLHYTEQLDKVKLTGKTIRVSADELAEAYRNAAPEFIEAISRIRDNVMQFQMGLLIKDASLPSPEQYELQLRYRPMRRVGVCIPGGAASYPSSLLMTVIPAQAAEVKEIVVVMPPTPNGAYNQDMLAVCHALGIKEVYRVGGAQAVAALAYGVDGLPAVDMIVGPGNNFVMLAKRQVYGKVAIDCLAGPSEIIVVADDSAQADLVAIDLIAQAEHSPGVPILVTWSETLIDEVEKSLVKLMKDLDRADAIRTALEEHGAFIQVPAMEDAVGIVNDLATEHLHIQTRDPENFADRIDSAGAIFIGQFSPVALGDYAAGPSHVLPTGGTARFASGLSANDFRRRTSIINYTRTGLREIAEDVILLANREGLTGHAASVRMRLKDASPAQRPPKKVAKVKAK
jgi:histidinol dehydrogenase